MVSIYHSRLNSSAEIIQHYKGDQPLSGWLKTWFSRFKKYGSRDRKEISALCYNYYRLGKWHFTSAAGLPERILTAQLLCGSGPTPLLATLKPTWEPVFTATLQQKIQLLHAEGIPFMPADIFPWRYRLSDGIDADDYARSFLVQPDLFLRIRPGHAQTVLKQLADAGIPFSELSADAIALPNTTDIKQVLAVNRQVVVQDYNSQNISAFLKEIALPSPNTWDCCAASGGKSILATDALKGIKLTVSDIRPTILANLKKRFAEAGLTRYDVLQLNLEKKPEHVRNAPFDLIICDAPCTGSGTWGRTPEQLYFFKDAAIEGFSKLQHNIAGNALAFLRKGGYFLYITCSVFKEENEAVVAHLQHHFGLTLLRMECLKGYDKRADTMFGALLIKR